MRLFLQWAEKVFRQFSLGHTQVRAVSRYFVYMKQRENPNGIGGEGSSHTVTAATCPRRTGPDPGAAGNKYRCRCNWIAIKIDSSGGKGVKFMNSCSSSPRCPDVCHGVEWDRDREREETAVTWELLSTCQLTLCSYSQEYCNNCFFTSNFTQ